MQADDVGRRRRVRASEICRSKGNNVPYFSKGKPVSSWLILKSSDIFLYKSLFCASNLWPAFCFVLSPCSPLITQRIRPTSSAGTASAYHSQQKWEKRVYYIWNMDIYLTKMHGFATGGLYSPPGAVWLRDVLLQMRTLYFTSSELLTTNTRLPPLKGSEGPGQFLL